MVELLLGSELVEYRIQEITKHVTPGGCATGRLGRFILRRTTTAQDGDILTKEHGAYADWY